MFRGCPRLFATVFDLTTNRTAEICSGGSDVTVTSFAYTTYGSRAAVVIHSLSDAGPSPSSSALLEYFLIKCETVGCADLTPVGADVWAQRFGARMQLGCVTSSVTWQMFCVDGWWQGPHNNCTPSGTAHHHHRCQHRRGRI